MITKRRVFHSDLVIKRLGARVKAPRVNGVADRGDIIKRIG